MTPWLDLALTVLALGAALSLRPWRGVSREGPPGLWLAWALLMAVFWCADRLAAMPMAPPLSGACLPMLTMGWPLAMLALLPVTGLAAWGDVWLCGMIVAILVAFRPHWLATCADRIYLPK